MNENIFDKLDFGPFRALLDDDDITDVSYDNNGQIWIRSLTQGSMRVEIEGATPDFVEKLAFQCSNVMGTTFNNAKPFLDAESAELRMNFVHQSIATNGIALVIRKTPAKIRLDKDKLIQEDYFTPAIHDFLIKCVEGHCNIMVAGETGSGKTEFVKYLASHTKVNEKIITIEDTLELHLDKIYPQRDIVAMKTNNVASYSDVLVTCMRQNPKWILLSEVRSAEAVSAVRNSISSGHNILSTIHADKASAIPYRLYSLMETDLDVSQFLTTIYRYIQLGVHIKAFYSKEYGKFHRELDEVAEFYVDDNNVPQSRIIYQKQMGRMMMCKPSDHLIQYIENQNISVQDIIKDLPDELPLIENKMDSIDEMNDENNDSNDGEVVEGLTPVTDPEKNLDNVLNGDTNEEPSMTEVSNEEGIAPDVNVIVDDNDSNQEGEQGGGAEASMQVSPVETTEEVAAPVEVQPEITSVVPETPQMASVTPVESPVETPTMIPTTPDASAVEVPAQAPVTPEIVADVSVAVPTMTPANVVSAPVAPTVTPVVPTAEVPSATPAQPSIVSSIVQPSTQPVVIQSQNINPVATPGIPTMSTVARLDG